MYVIMCLVFTLTISFATDVSVYKFDDYYDRESRTADPVVVSSFPLKFWFHSDDWHYMRIHIKNQSTNGTSIKFKCHTDVETFEAKIHTVLRGKRKGEPYYWFDSLSLDQTTEMKIYLYTNNSSSSLLVAVGRPVGNVMGESTADEYKYIDECSYSECVLVVDLKSGESIDSTVIIVSSSAGTVFILLVIIIAIWKYCWNKRKSQVSTNEHTEPCYENMVFRRECDEEIAEIDQHIYEEIVYATRT
ncbi:hypothetical protein PYW07_011325 [Mythimna separata]|uniref:Uncharacterized protein n=1 Tax=Mythimna separata TaxID=271217 RepID=A0AAD7Y9H3_MYTSE|nr:hypothetical protein PYW07_011325 [Mythimna separata]